MGKSTLATGIPASACRSIGAGLAERHHVATGGRIIVMAVGRRRHDAVGPAAWREAMPTHLVDSARVLPARPSNVLEMPRDVLTWIVLGLVAWLAIGVLTAILFGAFVGGPDQDDQELT